MSNILKIAPELLKSGVKILLEARGKSMLPVFGPGDRLTVEPCGFDAIREGDIVVYENAHEPKEVWLVAHRVVKKEASAKGRFLLTKGESPLQDQETLLDAGAVLGKVVHIKKVILNTGPRTMDNGPWTRLFLKFLVHGLWSMVHGPFQEGKMIYKKHGDIVSRKIMDEVILVPIRKNVANMQSIFTLNETGAKIWEWIDGKNTEEDIAKALAKEHDMEESVVRKDVSTLIAQLKEVGAIEALSV